MEFDVLIENGEIVDGTSGDARREDVGITGKKIAAVGDLSTAAAAETVDAAGMVVTPGFIDMHSHADSTAAVYPSTENFLAQGITTAVTGNCGFSPAPLTDYYAAGFWEWNWWEKINPRKYDAEPIADLQPVREAMREHEGIDLSWDTFASFITFMNQLGTGINIAPLVGHNTIRTAVMGHDYRREADDAEISRMKQWVREAMEAGAFGISNGLDYAPGAFAGEDELVEVVRQASEGGGLFATHWRRTGLREKTGSPVMGLGLKEAIRICRRAEADRLQVSHLLPGYSVFPSPPQRLIKAAAELTIEMLQEGIEDGLDIHWDVIPNTTGGVISARYLAAPLNPWLKQAGTLEGFSRNLRAPDLREEIREFIEAGRWYSLNPVSNPGWASGIIISHHTAEDLAGSSLQEIADDRGEDPLSTMFSLLQQDPYTCCRPPSGGGEALQVFVQHPKTTVGLDTFAFDTSYEVTVPPYYLPHPNTFGGMPRFFNQLGIPLLGLPEAVHRVTRLPAAILGLDDRGQLREGFCADIAVFDPDSYKSCADHEEPRRLATGISYLLVNGEFAVHDGEFTESRSGRTLTR